MNWMAQRGLNEVLGDPSAVVAGTKAKTASISQRLRSYAALLRAAVMASSEAPFGRDFVGKVFSPSTSSHRLLSPPPLAPSLLVPVLPLSIVLPSVAGSWPSPPPPHYISLLLHLKLDRSCVSSV